MKVAVVAVLLVVLATAGGIWKVQDWRYGKTLADQAGLHQSDLDTITNAANAAQQAEQDKRLALEQRLAASEQTHFRRR